PVEQHRFRHRALAGLKRLLAVFRLDDLEIQAFQDAPCNLSNDTRVIDNKTCSHGSLTCFQFPGGDSFHSSYKAPLSGALRRLCVRREFEDAIDIEDDHELAVEAMDAASELGHAGVEVDGVFFTTLLRQAQDFADLVDEEAVGFAAQVD